VKCVIMTLLRRGPQPPPYPVAMHKPVAV
jgi:hypothetical protein